MRKLTITSSENVSCILIKWFCGFDGMPNMFWMQSGGQISEINETYELGHKTLETCITL